LHRRWALVRGDGSNGGRPGEPRWRSIARVAAGDQSLFWQPSQLSFGWLCWLWNGSHWMRFLEAVSCCELRQNQNSDSLPVDGVCDEF